MSDSDGMKDIWRKYMDKLLNVKKNTGIVMWSCWFISEEEVAVAIFKGVKIGKAAGPTGVESERKASGGFGG